MRPSFSVAVFSLAFVRNLSFLSGKVVDAISRQYDIFEKVWNLLYWKLYVEAHIVFRISKTRTNYFARLWSAIDRLEQLRSENYKFRMDSDKTGQQCKHVCFQHVLNCPTYVIPTYVSACNNLLVAFEISYFKLLSFRLLRIIAI